jgi:transcription-repair coupling factor (superfamily II helicase)
VTPSFLAALEAAPTLREAREVLDREGRLDLSGLLGASSLLVPLLLTRDPLLLVLPHERDVEDAARDLATLATEIGAQGAVLAFPSPGPPYRGLPRHPDASLRRAAALAAARSGQLRALVASPAGLLRPVLTASLFETRVLLLRQGEEFPPEWLTEALAEAGYRWEDPVTTPGQMARRGGIVDVFPPARPLPVRIEFFGDSAVSLRAFDPETQRTTASVESIEMLPLSDVFAPRSVLEKLGPELGSRFAERRELPGLLERMRRGTAEEETVELLGLLPGVTVPLWEHLGGFALAVLEPEEVEREALAFHARAAEDRGRHLEQLLPEPDEALVASASLVARLDQPPVMRLRVIDEEARGRHLAALPVRRFAGDLTALSRDLRARAQRTVLLLGSPGRADRLLEVLREDGIDCGEGGLLEVKVGALTSGFELPELALRVLADGDIFPEEIHLHPRGRRRAFRSFLSDFRDLKAGDLVVHQDHGIGRFEGLETLEVGGTSHDFMVLVYHGGDKLKVPTVGFDRIQKYASVEGARPALDRLGSGNWDRVKRRVKKAMRDMAAELLALYAERKARPGHAFAADNPWLAEFEESFEYEETPDQAAAIADVASDMASGTPMDRLICGDVGYGKTEIAMRAAMRAVLDGKQVALLAPTTVLAFQHAKTFRKRFAPFPVRVEMLSRFRPPREIKQVLAGVELGSVDVLIGTHRLLSKDVRFKDLGLLVIDEEQRFGVQAKERLKQMRRTVDCLTLSATPIPRTLQMGLAGIRDMSVIETPPKDRLAIHTSIVKFSTEIIAAAIRQELAREGQVFVVHNRVESIYSLANLATRLVPEARVGVAHGQMPEAMLEKNMLAFVEGRVDVLVATTIIENGLDIPRANTLIVNRADRFGLAQLYQLRGRVGRSDRRAYAYLLVPPDTVLSGVARRRLAAIREFSDLGAGFRIAALDLELRGAGNLLGGEQSGHMEAVGLDLYVKLLEQTVAELKGEESREGPRAVFHLNLPLRLPPEYVPEMHQRIALYKRMSEVRDAGEIARLAEEVRDRYGALPVEVDDLLVFSGLRLRADALGVARVDGAAGALVIRFSRETPLSPGGIVDVVRGWPGVSFSPEQVLKVPLAPDASPLSVLGELLSALEAKGDRVAAPGL